MYLANFNYVRALQGVVLAIALVGPLAFLYFMAGPVSLPNSHVCKQPTDLAGQVFIVCRPALAFRAYLPSLSPACLLQQGAAGACANS